MQQVRPRLTHEQWISLIQEQQAGSSSIEAFCADRMLAVHSFYYHRKKNG